MKICRTMFWSLVCFVGISASTLGCHNNTYYCEGGYCSDGDGLGSTQAQLCFTFCDRLVTCGVIGSADRAECQSTCSDQYDKNPEATESGCACVERDACRDVEDYHCPGAPLPGGGSSSGGASSSGASSSSGGTSSGGGGGTCQINHDCGPNEDCIEGVCLSRCDQSCQCSAGESCVEGYCQGNTPPPASCTVDCDCPQGQSCVNGTCL